MENCQRNHLFEASSVSGVFVYSIDQEEPVYLKFTHTIRIKILFDTLDRACGKAFDVVTAVLHPPTQCAEQPCESLSVTDNTSQYGDEAVEQSMNSEPFHSEPSHQVANQNTSNTGQCKLSIDSVRKADISDKNKKSKNFKHESKLITVSPREFQPEISHPKQCQSTKDSPETFQLKLRSSSSKVHGVQRIKKKLIKRKTQKNKLDGFPGVKRKKRSNENKTVKEKSKPAQEETKKLQKEKQIQCEFCGVVFSNQLQYYNHRRAEESKHTCIVCGKVEPYEAHLIVHMQKHRRTKTDVSNLGQSSSENALPKELKIQPSSGKSKKNKKVKMKCNLCGLVLSSKDSLKIHTMLHTGECAYKCCVCGEMFSSLSSRQHHMDTHVSVQRFKCNPCGQRFASRAELAKHQLTHEIKCALCGQVFPNKTSRTCHFRVCHPQDILKCSLCSNLFATEEDLSRHMIYHKKGKKEQCPECGVVVSKLKDHMLLHSQQPQEKMFVCDQCPMSYLRKSNLERHLRTHTGEKPYACNECTKCFRSNGMLRKHLLTHTQEKPYQCEVCGKRCAIRSNLNIHMRVHNNDRNYPCSLCPQAFSYKNSLHGHIKSKHSRETDGQTHSVKLTSCHHPSQQAAQHLMTEMDPSIQDIPLGLQPSMSPELLLKSDSSMVPQQNEFIDIHPHMSYTSNIHSLSTTTTTTTLLLDTDRIPLIMQAQNSSHQY